MANKRRTLTVQEVDASVAAYALGESITTITRRHRTQPMVIRAALLARGVHLRQTPRPHPDAGKVVDGRLRCSGCGVSRPLSDFGVNRSRVCGLQKECKACATGRAREWEAAHPAQVAAGRFARTLRRYGMTADEFAVRLEEQGGVCLGCGAATAYTGGRLVVDHDHTTGRVRGLLCTSCNRAVGFAQDNPAVLRALAAYLEAATQSGAAVRPRRIRPARQAATIRERIGSN